MNDNGFARQENISCLLNRQERFGLGARVAVAAGLGHMIGCVAYLIGVGWISLLTSAVCIRRSVI
ncbi:hypothetical protein D3C86_2030220 [compost metagenome]